MKKPEKETKTAGPPEQILPDQDPCGISASTGIPSDSPSATPSSTNLPKTSFPVWLERLHELISLHAIRLTDSGRDHFRVNIDPGNGITLSLELRWHRDGIAVQPQFHSGDLDQLGRHWSQLQQELEPRGINLAPLPSAHAAEGKPSSPPRRDHTRNSSAKAGGTEFAFGGSMTESPISRRQRSKTHSGCGGSA